MGVDTHSFSAVFLTPRIIFKMISIIIKIILVLFAIFSLFTFFDYTSLFLNLAALIALFFLIRKDLRDRDNHKYYIASLFLTALFFIFSRAELLNNFLVLTEKIFLSIITAVVVIVYLFAHLIGFVHESYYYLKKKYKR